MRVVVLLVAFDVLGLPAVSDVMRQLLLWLPNLVVAVFVLFIGGIAARAMANIVRGATAEAGFANPETLANVVRTFMGRGLRLGAIGGAVGVVTALALTRFLASTLYGVSATDVVSFARAVGIVLGGVVVATIVPAWRAARINPLRALRYQ